MRNEWEHAAFTGDSAEQTAQLNANALGMVKAFRMVIEDMTSDIEEEEAE